MGHMSTHMTTFQRREDERVSVRELRNTMTAVLRRVEAGDRVTVPVDRRPVAGIVPIDQPRKVSWATAMQIAARHPADRGLLSQVREYLGDTTDEA